jgi:hypothetical protein
MAKNTAAVAAVAIAAAFARPSTNGSSGAAPHTTNAAKVAPAAFNGEARTLERPCSSASMVSTQTSRRCVIRPVISSRSAPSNPFCAKICRISSASPAGSVRMWRSSIRRSRR